MDLVKDGFSVVIYKGKLYVVPTRAAPYHIEDVTFQRLLELEYSSVLTVRQADDTIVKSRFY